MTAGGSWFGEVCVCERERKREREIEIEIERESEIGRMKDSWV